MAENDTLINALIGAVVTVVTAFLPFSPVIGGAVAGYLQGPDTDAGLRVGALSGAIAALPISLLALLVLGFFLFDVTVAAVATLFFLFAFVAALLYSAVLGAVGGFVGAYVKREDVV